MYKLIRPLIFLLPPEAAHGLSKLYYKLFSGFFKPYENPNLKTKVAGLKFENPIGLAAGYDKDAEIPAALLRTGFGFVEVGTITPNPQPGNPKPRLFRLPKDRAVINRLGFNSGGAERALENIKTFKQGKSAGILGINIGANKDSHYKISDYVTGLQTFSDFADYITINISSPNTPGLRVLQHTKVLDDMLKTLTLAVSGKPAGHKKCPFFIKIAPDLDDKELGGIITQALKHKIAGLIISNTTVERPKSLKSAHKGETGGLSGQPLFDPSTAMLTKAYKISKGKLPLIGVGGIASAEKAYEKILNGASLVQLYTGLIYEGPGLPNKIAQGLAVLLKRDGYSSVTEAVGKKVKL